MNSAAQQSASLRNGSDRSLASWDWDVGAAPGGSENVCSWHRTNLPASRQKNFSRGNVCQQFISAAQANKRDG